MQSPRETPLAEMNALMSPVTSAGDTPTSVAISRRVVAFSPD
jgi:hypothetical protein